MEGAGIYFIHAVAFVLCHHDYYNTSIDDQQKVVNVGKAELRIVGWDFGTKHKKHEHWLGRLHLASDDGKIEVSIGQFPDKFRDQSTEELNDLIGRICSVKFKNVIDSETKKGMKSLYLPRYDGIRYDRNDTDDLIDVETR